MGKPYSDDLRERVVAAIEAGHTREEVAELYNMAQPPRKSIFDGAIFAPCIISYLARIS
jgi:hypothetical protein